MTKGYSNEKVPGVDKRKWKTSNVVTGDSVLGNMRKGTKPILKPKNPIKLSGGMKN